MFKTNYHIHSEFCDGIYGSQTLAAVKYFQRKNGLTVDGIAGKKTLEAMGIFNSSGNSNSSNSTSSSDLNLLARTESAYASFPKSIIRPHHPQRG